MVMKKPRSKPNPKREAKRKPPTTAVQVRLWPDDLERLDDWISEQDDPKPTRPEALRRLAGFDAAKVVGAGKERQYVLRRRRKEGE
jgi:hypothetical protein